MSDKVRQLVRKILTEKYINSLNEEDGVVEKGLEKSKTEELLGAFVNNQTSNNLVEIRYTGEFSPLKFADARLIKGSVDIYFVYKSYQCTLSVSFDIDEQNPSSNLVTILDFYANSSGGEEPAVKDFDDFRSLSGNLAGKTTRKAEVLIQQKISIDKG